ncbi:cation transporter [Tenacibaculum ovolyticum]|jgi:cation transport ATPase|uniref:heavy-metal-associated domain-containing protein n=1 Tax=Tenacibaculum ovolyticum TaxID=104270 RepID=UPI0007EC5484|nr:cation transporter [Tenacibaculum ovolyticum]WBX77283.1 cation transporter [Tenacibaculum ovolyticum]
MRKIVLVISILLISVTASAQQKKKNAKVSLDVDGVCKMCKGRIEKAALNCKGVKYAQWNVNTHELKLIVDERKTSVKTIQQNLANVGHDTKEIKATKEAYDNLHPCCKYRDEEIKEDHKVKKM